jgi:signal transduction histidine kinase
MRLISDVLDYAKVESGKAAYAITDVPVDETLRAACALVQPQMQARRITCRLDVCQGPVAARADPERVQQILLNLLSNAVKFTAPGGQVHVECAVEGASVRVRVRDNGIGIAPERLESVFEPFVQIDAGLTRTHGGVGLGLAISRDLARDMGGDLLAESRPGEGSTFSLVLPRSHG